MGSLTARQEKYRNETVGVTLKKAASFCLYWTGFNGEMTELGSIHSQSITLQMLKYTFMLML